ncbi:glycosyl hydrolase 115 family protein [Gilvimarinus sp. SDUM040013]|uniref:Glycosyl hydrolase 115 family protein n=1 Tax=Gilvimarinus gilvus TaxID=3058038 RepID=A0ABU4RYJ5_9GAMM|nr:glycosyl hydrolase 115 family protein [Gilvimarinus sp. SDUM040013]MDO3385638.1 glycosyl hydrolase 115 family protein [Gilvimarinus sp. SDUM040013]MDX6849972.1 glycosyl hydrolase 115 family protein [Gilvimarinus sp. SDUM040013]
MASRPVLYSVLITVVGCLVMSCSSQHNGASTPLSLNDTVSFSGTDYVHTSKPAKGAFPLVSNGHAAPIWVSQADHTGVLQVAEHLQQDINRVTGQLPRLVHAEGATGPVVLVGTLGKSPVIDTLVEEGKLDVSQVQGRWDTYALQTLENPLPGVEQALAIVGSNKRGTIYGMYELAQNIGVSPWHWWADVPVKKSKTLYVESGFHYSGEPVVKYRGIFINDDWGLMPWAQEKFGGYNSDMYAHVYDLLLRMRANYLWPGMLGKSIYRDDPESARLADELGIVLGTSHHEPMTRAHSDWSRAKSDYGNAEWNYETNKEGLKKFWREGIERNKDHEVLITIGMRGDGDKGLEGDVKNNIQIMEDIVSDQRSIIEDVKGKPAEEVPQVWALYKEVQDYYEKGMEVPDDVILLWCDDNWGNLRRVPTAQERTRSGGAGIYYHFDYHGAPRSYEWINTNPLPKVWEQMNLAYEYGANKIWVANVGDIKPMEVPTEFFLEMAWNPKAMNKEKIAEFTVKWAEREFGGAYAKEIADIVTKYAKYNAWRKPELLSPDTFSLVNHREAERVLEKWTAISQKAEAIYEKLPAEYQSAFYQLVLYPAKASANVVDLYITAGRNQLYARQGRVSANVYAQEVAVKFERNEKMIEEYHSLENGKWNHMMSYPFIGYTSWNAPDKNTMPEVSSVDPKNEASMGVAMEGSEFSWAEQLAPNTITFELEAFSGQERFSPFVVIADQGASRGKAVVWPESGTEAAITDPDSDESGRFGFTFELSEPSTLTFKLRLSAANTHDDSLFYRLNSGEWQVKNNVESTGGYLVVDVNTFSDVPAGTHTIEIMRREDGLKLDRAYLTANSGQVSSAQAQGAVPAELPTFDSINQQTYWVDVFNRGTQNVAVDIKATKPWIQISDPQVLAGGDTRYWVDVDWSKAPVGKHSGAVVVSEKGGDSVTITVNAVRSDKFEHERLNAHGGLTGPITFAAESYHKNVAKRDVAWEKIPDYGRGVSGMSVFPARSESAIPAENAPYLEYDVFIAEPGEYTVDVITGIALNIQPDRGVRLAVSFDNHDPVVIDAFSGEQYQDPSERKDKSSPAILSWYEWVKDNARTMSSQHKISEPGIHRLKIWMVDPGVVLEKVVVHRGDVRKSYLGPPVSEIH